MSDEAASGNGWNLSEIATVIGIALAVSVAVYFLLSAFRPSSPVPPKQESAS